MKNKWSEIQVWSVSFKKQFWKFSEPIYFRTRYNDLTSIRTLHKHVSHFWVYRVSGKLFLIFFIKTVMTQRYKNNKRLCSPFSLEDITVHRKISFVNQETWKDLTRLFPSIYHWNNSCLVYAWKRIAEKIFEEP